MLADPMTTSGKSLIILSSAGGRTTPEKMASIARFNTVLNKLSATKSLTEINFEYNFFAQPCFIKDFKQFTGDIPENFKRFLQKNDFLQSQAF